ncbi:hypothetical protein [Pseudomonas phage Astolliot]|nr:hypothetical protein [Pseudomonas phage Astolliot]
MKFEISLMVEGWSIEARPVNWIKSFREATGLDLRAAKDIADVLRQDYTTGQIVMPAKVMVSSTDRGYEHLQKIDPRYFKSGDFVKLVEIQPKVSAEQVLKNTAIRLIRSGSIGYAIGVLELLK